MKIDVLDKGYIEVVDKLGDDLTPVNAARVSFGGRSEDFTDKDKRLSKFLMKHKQLQHTLQKTTLGTRYQVVM